MEIRFFFVLMICFLICGNSGIYCTDASEETSNSRKASLYIGQGDLIPRVNILNHALASAEMALKHVKDDWIPLFDKNAVLDDPNGSHEFSG